MPYQSHQMSEFPLPARSKPMNPEMLEQGQNSSPLQNFSSAPTSGHYPMQQPSSRCPDPELDHHQLDQLNHANIVQEFNKALTNTDIYSKCSSNQGREGPRADRLRQDDTGNSGQPKQNLRQDDNLRRSNSSNRSMEKVD